MNHESTVMEKGVLSTDGGSMSRPFGNPAGESELADHGRSDELDTQRYGRSAQHAHTRLINRRNCQAPPSQ